MHTYSRKLVCGMSLMLVFLVTSTMVYGKTKSLDEKLPTTEAEFRGWLTGTEWRVKVDGTNQTMYHIIRFYPRGVMKSQKNTRKWDEDKAIIRLGYKIRGFNRFQYGYMGWMVEMDKQFKEFKGKCSNSTKCKGCLLGRFDVNK